MPSEEGACRKETQEFGATVDELERLAAWLRTYDCPVVAMESTCVYWKPGGRGRRRESPGHDAPAGRKTDKTDADWISELLAHDLIAPSFIPGPAISALRDLTRLRVTFVQTRSQAKNRVHKVLEDTNIKLSSVVSDLFGVSARKMLQALIDGDHDPAQLAALAVGTLRKKIPQLELALRGHFTEHHAAMIQMGLAQVDLLNRQIADIDQRIATLAAPHAAEQAHLDTIPGVDEIAARCLLAEIGPT